LNLAYSNDLSESGGLSFYKDKRSFFEGSFHEFFVDFFDKTEKASASVSFRTFRYMQANISFSKILKTPVFNYEYATTQQNTTILSNQFNYTELQLGLRYAYKEKYMKSRYMLVPIPTKYPIVCLNYTKGIKGILDGEYDYQKMEAKIEKSFYSNYLGKTTFVVLGGYIDKNLPYNMLYVGQAGYNGAYIDIPYTFNTMRYNEFVSNRYASLMFRHSFGSLLFRKKKFVPEVVVLSNAMVGSMNNIENHRGITLQSPKKGYFESGLCINNLLNFGFSGIGIGAYYRYGAYQLDKGIDNWAFKFTASIFM